jgi:imidazolonepropionase-like amidohydrolase
MSDDLGTIEAGKIADIIAVGESPLSDITVLENVAAVIKSGTMLKGLHRE